MTCLRALALEGEASHAEEEQETRSRLRGGERDGVESAISEPSRTGRPVVADGGIVGTDPTKRLFFRWLAVEKGEKWRREGQ
jgi:hypothetical protein